MRCVVFFGEEADGTDNYVTCVAYVVYMTYTSYTSYTTYTGRAAVAVAGQGCGWTTGGGPGRCGRGAAARGLTCR